MPSSKEIQQLLHSMEKSLNQEISRQISRDMDEFFRKVERLSKKKEEQAGALEKKFSRDSKKDLGVKDKRSLKDSKPDPKLKAQLDKLEDAFVRETQGEMRTLEATLSQSIKTILSKESRDFFKELEHMKR